MKTKNPEQRIKELEEGLEKSILEVRSWQRQIPKELQEQYQDWSNHLIAYLEMVLRG